MIARVPAGADGADVQMLDWLQPYPVRLVLLGGMMWETRRLAYAAVTGILHSTINGLFTQPFPVAAPAAVLVIAMFAGAYWLGARLIEHRRLDELRLAEASRPLALGFAAGGLLFGAAFAVIAGEGCATYQGFAGVSHAASLFAIFAAGALAEELIFRGLIYRILADWVGAWPAAVVSALVFAAAHAGNTGISIIALLSVFGLGVTCALLYRLTRSLWLPFGLHFGWNFAQGGIFGVPVSGHPALGVFRFQVSGPRWLTGGAFGPENTVQTVVLLSLTCLALAWLIRRRRAV